MDNNYYNLQILNVYNNAYNSYLSEIEPSIFLHTLLKQIIKIINAKCGVILKYDNDTQKFSILTHASNNSNTHASDKDVYFANSEQMHDNWYTFSKLLKHNNKFNDNSLLVKTVNNKSPL